ncbi:iron chelate uptake ABC transporter family permease subunit [Nocardioides zeae]|uniref:Iron chelate uptake ABC transporter family permease subunit n=1 Tax=Nocardioides imazamoxiresistens TaxID=3231893 RepID=A0ABU3Q1E5_9ACTN|nr:iron chelate uptake ABC transporter family permease subunit [Nocardioides zeae]MDT9594951.1 iron chelate uptake ABC transporter family permease subunit [Nocardioides zeae]
MPQPGAGIGSGRRPGPGRAVTARELLFWSAGPALLLVSVAVAITIGPADLAVGEVVAVVRDRLGGADAGLSRIREGIVWELRLPRSLLAAACGAGLGVSGVVLQSLLRNALADPYVLGISSGASTGAVLVVVLGLGAGSVGLSGGAFVGAVVAFGLVAMLGYAAGGSPDRLILAGVAGTQLFAALTSFVVLTSADPEKTRGVLFWLLGSLGGARWDDVVFVGAVVSLATALCWAGARVMDAFTFGEEAAASLGVAVVRSRLALLLLTAAMTAAVVAAAGAIGFVGLVLPHAARAVVGPGHRRLLPATALAGAVLLVWVDALARVVIAPQELPVGVVTALVGVPAFAVILWRRRRR